MVWSLWLKAAGARAGPGPGVSPIRRLGRPHIEGEDAEDAQADNRYCHSISSPLERGFLDV
jgi:hypothetical protein